MIFDYYLRLWLDLISGIDWNDQEVVQYRWKCSEITAFEDSSMIDNSSGAADMLKLAIMFWF